MEPLKKPRPNRPRVKQAHGKALLGLLAISLALIGPAHACEIKSQHTHFVGKMLHPTDSVFKLFSDPNQSPIIKVSVSKRPNSVFMPQTKQNRRLRIVGGEQLRVEDIRLKSGLVHSLNFEEKDMAFAGSLRLLEGNERRASGWKFQITNLNGKTAGVWLTYDAARNISDALDDAICTYQHLAQMIEQDAI